MNLGYILPSSKVVELLGRDLEFARFLGEALHKCIKIQGRFFKKREENNLTKFIE